MGDLFVQESTIASEKAKDEQQPSGSQKIVGGKTNTKTYSHEEAVEASIEYFRGDELAARVWANKYALKDSYGNLFEKSPDDMHHRIAREIHRIELKYKNPLPEELIYRVLKDFRYIVPQGGPMTGIGNDYQVASLSNCFVIGNDGSSDSYGGIMKIDQEQVQLMKRRGGVGHDLSHIRPKGTPVLNSALTSTGVVPFMERYSNSTREVAQDGRRGALFWDTIIRESVPDCYKDLGYATVSTNPCGEIPLCPYDSCRLLAINLYSYVNNPFTDKAEFDFDLYKEHVGLAQRMMDDIIDLELEKIDVILAKINADPEIVEIKHVEQNLWNNIRKKSEEGRRTGIGITAEGDMLAGLGMRYGTDEATSFSVEVHKTLALEAYKASTYLAKERGAFAIYDAEREKDNPFILRMKEADPVMYSNMVKYGRRNIALLTIAPTGTTSLMTQTTSGIEPIFSTFYKRRRKVNPNDLDVKVTFKDEVGDCWEEFNVFHHKFVDWLRLNGYDVDEVTRMRDEEIESIIAKSPYYKATANDVDWIAKVKMQGAIQKWVDHSISVTINLPAEAKEELVSELYLTAWKSGCKGATVYRDGSRNGVLIAGKTEARPERPKRPKVLDCDVIRFNINEEKWIAFVGLKESRPYEIFTGIADEEIFPIPKSIVKGKIIKIKDEDGNTRYDFQYTDKYGYKKTMGGLSHMFKPEFWNYAKLISGVLRHEMPIQDVVNLVTSLKLDSESINNWKNGVERALKRYIPNGTKAKGKCGECGSDNLVYEEGCLICKDCGSSKCG